MADRGDPTFHLEPSEAVTVSRADAAAHDGGVLPAVAADTIVRPPEPSANPAVPDGLRGKLRRACDLLPGNC